MAALHRLTCLTALSLATGATLHLTWPDGEDDDEDQPRDVQLPPLAGLTALTELQLRWLALPPPDWRQLSNLRRLGMRYSVDWEGEPLTGLVSLTHFSGYRKSLPEEAHNLARLPHLASVQAPKFGPKWRKQVEALLPHLAFIEERW